MNVKVDNSKCGSKIKDIKAKLFHTLTILTNDGVKINEIKNKITAIYTRQSVKAKEKKKVKIDIPLGEY